MSARWGCYGTFIPVLPGNTRTGSPGQDSWQLGPVLAKESLSWEEWGAGIGEGRGLRLGSPAERGWPSEAHSKVTVQGSGNSSTWKNAVGEV